MYALYILAIPVLGFLQLEPWWAWLLGLVIGTTFLSIFNPHTFAKMRFQRERLNMQSSEFNREYAKSSWIILIPAAFITGILYGFGWGTAILIDALL